MNEAGYGLRAVEAAIGAEITAAAKAAQARQRALKNAQEAVKEALETWRRLRAAAFGMAGRDRRYDPLEPLLAEQQLAAARTQYLTEVIGFNKAQFRLYTALGQPPLAALPHLAAQEVAVPVLPRPQDTNVPIPEIPKDKK